jgi:RNA polymerase sigma factor (sigma-70 family)
MSRPTPQAAQVLGALSATRADLSDADLLDRFVTRRDAEAFEALVDRHAALVLRACRSALRDRHAAEDAAQATFFALAHQAQSIRGACIAGWLFRVARRIAARAARRRRRDPLTAAATADQLCGAEPVPEKDPELERVLHEEIARLPERYRAPILLCYLEGLTFAEAGRQLGWPVGTVAGRASRAKSLLGTRLAHRGIAPAVLVVTATAVTTSFARVTATAAMAFADRGTADVPGRVLELATHEVRVMLATPFVRALRALGVITVGAALVLGLVWGADPPTAPPPRPAPVAPVPARAADTRLFVQRAQKLLAIDPGTGKEDELVHSEQLANFSAAVSPDGTQLAFAEYDIPPNPRPGGRVVGLKVTLRRLDAKGPDVVVTGISSDAQRLAFDWAPDSSRLRVHQQLALNPAREVPSDVLVDPRTGRGTPLALPKQREFVGFVNLIWPVFVEYQSRGIEGWFGDGRTVVLKGTGTLTNPQQDVSFTYHLYDVATGRQVPLEVPTGHWLRDWSRDGKLLLTADAAEGDSQGQLYLIPRGGKARKLTNGIAPLGLAAKLSPDGTRVAFVRSASHDPAGPRFQFGTEVYVMAVEGGKPVRVAEAPGGWVELGWSPDGKQLAYGWSHRAARGNEGTEARGFLGVCDADGTNQRTVVSETVAPSKEALDHQFGLLGWR